jgi:hypothetical protein
MDEGVHLGVLGVMGRVWNYQHRASSSRGYVADWSSDLGIVGLFAVGRYQERDCSASEGAVMARWPSGVALFRLKNSTNEHWLKGDIIELLSPFHEPPFNDYRIIHYCSRYSHEAWMWTLNCVHPLSDDARAMLAIAKAGAK